MEVIDKLNRKIITAFINNDVKQFQSLAGPGFLETINGADLELFVEKVHKILKDDKITVLEEFHVKNTSIGEKNILQGDGYTISFAGINQETYLSLIECNMEPNTTLLMGLIYGKYENAWKINILQVGAYKYNGMTANDLYLKSKKQHSKGHIIDASNNIFLAQQLLKPLYEILTFNQETEITDFAKQVFSELSYLKLPYELDKIKSKPQILGFSPKILSEGIFLLIEYKTNLDISNTRALKEEYLKIFKQLKQEFKGIDQENNIILFRALEQIPDGKTPVNTYTFAHEVQ
jgi:hypothetical protein